MFRSKRVLAEKVASKATCSPQPCVSAGSFKVRQRGIHECPVPSSMYRSSKGMLVAFWAGSALESSQL